MNYYSEKMLDYEENEKTHWESMPIVSQSECYQNPQTFRDWHIIDDSNDSFKVQE